MTTARTACTNSTLSAVVNRLAGSGADNNNDDSDRKEYGAMTTLASAAETSSSSEVDNDYKVLLDNLEYKKSSSATSIPGITSPPDSPLRRSLDEEHQKSRGMLPKGPDESNSSSKHLLRKSIHSLSFSTNTPGGVLTTQERTFLEMLLVSNDPGVDEACQVAHERLMDESIFSKCTNIMCDGVTSGGCNSDDDDDDYDFIVNNVDGRSPRRLTSQNIRQDDSVDWIPASFSLMNDKDTREGQQQLGGGGDTSKGGEEKPTTTDSSKPLLARRRSSEARLNRLLVRKEQALAGQDNNRLFRAHEAGLVVTPSGSARRSLSRMGLPIEKGLFLPNLPLPATTGMTDIDDEKQDVANELSSIMRNTDKSYEKALAKMDERTIRLLEKEGQVALNKVDEREIRRIEKEDNKQSIKPPTVVGGVSPFNINALRSMFASHQMSFRQSNSSYSRYDSFLTTETTDPGLFSDSSSFGGDKAEIFRPSPRATSSEERFKNLLINAGFKDDMGEDNTNELELLDANTEDDDEIFRSPSNSSVAMLTKGGPSYRHVNMFRESLAVDTRNPDDSEIEAEKIAAWESQLIKIESMTPNTNDAKQSTSDDVNVSPAASNSSDGSEVGDLPTSLSMSAREGLSGSNHGGVADSLQKPILTKRSSLPTLTSSLRNSRERSRTMGIIKVTSPLKKPGYNRSVSWGQMVISKDEEKQAMSPRRCSIASESSITSIISFPHLKKAAPIRSDSIGSITSTVFTRQPLRLGVPLRSSSTFSMSTVMSPKLARAHPVFSPMSSFISLAPPALSLAHSVRSSSPFDLSESVDANQTFPSGAAWERPVLHKSSSGSGRELGVYIRQASMNFEYEGMGMEVEDVPQLHLARKYRSMISIDPSIRGSVRSSRRDSSTSFSRPPLKSLDDSFIIKNIDFERHSSEILRSLSNLDLYSPHHRNDISKVAKITGDWTTSSSAKVAGGDFLNNDGSWDLESNNSFGQANAWDVLDDEYAEFGDPFRILGTSANDIDCHPHVLSPPLMETLQNFFPFAVSEQNFWLKYSLVRDGASLSSLLQHIRGSKHTLIAIETVEGEVFGSFTSAPWRKGWNYYGNGESFLWRMRRSRSEKDKQYSVLDQAKLESEVDVFYWTGSNDYVQYCTNDILAIGGGSLKEDDRDDQEMDKRDSPPLTPTGKAAGFGLSIDSDLLRGTSSSCATFQSPPLSKSHDNGDSFEILNIEVWTLTPFSTVAEAENQEMRTLFLESYNREL